MEKPATIAITATFTAEPLEAVLHFWMHELDLPLTLAFAPYNQVFQQLLDPTSLLAQNHQGINVVLIRFEDWLPDAMTTGAVQPGAPCASEAWEALERHVDDLIRAVHAATSRDAIPYLVGVCPVSRRVTATPGLLTRFERMEARLVAALADLRGVYPITATELTTTYPVASFDDLYGVRFGHIPFTSHGFVALGTCLARKIYGLKHPPHKVIVLDCDQTLWQGVCGEDGALGVQVTASHQALQRFMITQQEQGMLLCLCSKNHEDDVFEVFARHPDMLLTREHLVAWRINWLAKSMNLRSLAAELQLGLDSFIFLDDNPVECAEVQASCPEVLTLQLPQDPQVLPRFLRHVWAFDHIKVTEEDRQRTAFYQQNREREQFRHRALSLEEFLAGLQLQVDMLPLAPHHCARVAQLTQRTNQFNTTTIRRLESEVQQLCQTGEMEGLVVVVNDRFGDYGLMGVLFFTEVADTLSVDTILLSCRAFGKGVEHRMLARLGAIARSRGLAWVEVRYCPTKRNQPALDFLQSVGAAYQQPEGNDLLFRFPVAVAAALTYKPAEATCNQREDTSVQPEASETAPSVVDATPGMTTTSTRMLRIATELWDSAHIAEALMVQQRRSRPALSSAFVAPCSPVEESLVAIWEHVLGVKPIGVQDNLFELGGHSLAVMQILARIRETFRREVPLSDFFEAPTVAGLALSLVLQQTTQEEPHTLSQLLDELDQPLSTNEQPGLDVLVDPATSQAHRSKAPEVQTRVATPGVEEYCCVQSRPIPVGDHTEIVYSPVNQRPHLLPAAMSALLTHCRQFKTLDAHAQAICQGRRLDPEHLGAIKAQLSQLIERGLLVSKERLLHGFDQTVDAPQPPGITTIGFVTHNRCEALQRALTSYIDNSKRYGRTPDFVVVDDSPDADIRDQYRRLLHALQAQYQVPIFYAGSEEKRRFAEQLRQSGHVPQEVIDFAFFDAEQCGAGAGANRNALLLHTVGEMVLSVDDDTVCHMAVAPQRAEGLRLTSGVDPAEFWFFLDRDTTLQSVTRMDTDILALHEQLLGKAVDSLLSRLGSTAALDTSQLDTSLLHRLLTQKSRVCATFNGSFGDCGWGSPFGYWGAPMGSLLLDAASHARLVQTEADYRQGCTSREILRTVRQPTLSDATFCMSHFMGLDNRSGLPPFLPVRRGQDMIFGLTTWRCWPDSVFGHLPWALLHAPVEARRFWPGELFRSASGSDVAKLLIACMQSCDFGPGQREGYARLQALGRHLMDIGGMPLHDFEVFVHMHTWQSNSTFIALMEEHLHVHRESPTYWATDVRKYITMLRQALMHKDYWVPLDLVDGKNLDATKQLAQRIVYRFGQLLFWWPALVQATRELRSLGCRLGVSV